MLIKEWMSGSVITIDYNDSLSDAVKLFQTRVISMLPVLKKGKIAGIITDGDIKKAMPSDATSLDRFEIPSLLDSVEIGSVMSKPVVTIRADHTVDEAAGIMLQKGISGMPVLDNNGNIEGILTKSDIFRCFVSFTGVSNKGQIFAFKLKDRPGVIKTLTDIIRKNNGRLCSIMTSYDDIEEGYRKVFFHAFDIDPSSFDYLVEKFHEAGELYYVADLSRGFRKIF
ncbi:MAG: CBS and ACT domain-containing protein [Proteobacteria bacterium]|nr:CBS and ACT domain-containing protein [Pseudomonadota bacterium]MBU1586178.1 CBS and ACT domain-containing protein [Pseudomonadota bacterium]MBU2453049.1 CBS and ACT domain-containing protein [Pseudomonadota bacterium]MBU2631993.1 CBS and ACT domain-containing protein [Pseudomonadota bacterium]